MDDPTDRVRPEPLVNVAHTEQGGKHKIVLAVVIPPGITSGSAGVSVELEPEAAELLGQGLTRLAKEAKMGLTVVRNGHLAP